MYYEERIIGGTLCCRTTPNGAWRVLSTEQLTRRYLELKDMLDISERSNAVLAAELATYQGK